MAGGTDWCGGNRGLRRATVAGRTVVAADISGLNWYVTAGRGDPDAAAERRRVRVDTI